jgi:hypothetical protein
MPITLAAYFSRTLSISPGTRYQEPVDCSIAIASATVLLESIVLTSRHTSQYLGQLQLAAFRTACQGRRGATRSSAANRLHMKEYFSARIPFGMKEQSS